MVKRGGIMASLGLCALVTVVLDLGALSLVRALRWNSLAPLVASSAAMGAGVLAVLLFMRNLDPKSNRPLAAVMSAAWVCVGIASTSGPSIASSWWRWLLVALLAISAAGGFACIAQLRKGIKMLCAAGIVALIGVDFFVLPRLYPAFHLGVILTAFALVAELAFRAHAVRLRNPKTRWSLGGAGGLLTAVGAVTASYFAVPGMPIAGKALALRPLRPDPHIEARVREAETPDSAWSFLGRDIVVLSIDAVRSDMVNRETMPKLQRRTKQGVYFSQAYTPTPNSSYALASMHTGQWVHAAAMLQLPLPKHTLASEMQKLGYRSQAVFPPSIFSVDGASLKHYLKTGFGFMNRDAEAATMAEVCAKLQKELGASAKPLLFWSHLTQPHQPYTPRRARFGDGPKERYRAELFEIDVELDACLDKLYAHSRRPVVVITADHGEAFGEHRSYYHGSTLYQEQLRVPLLVLGAQSEASVVDSPVSLIDLAPTLLAALDHPAPASMLGCDLSRPKRIPRTRLVGVLNDTFAVRNAEQKAICDGVTGRCEVFALDQDPDERHPEPLHATWAQVKIVESLGWLAGASEQPAIDQPALDQSARGAARPVPKAQMFGCHEPERALFVARAMHEPLFLRIRALRSLDRCPVAGEPLAIELLNDGYMRTEAAAYLMEHGSSRAIDPVRARLANERYLAGKQALNDALEALELRAGGPR